VPAVWRRSQQRSQVSNGGACRRLVARQRVALARWRAKEVSRLIHVLTLRSRHSRTAQQARVSHAGAMQADGATKKKQDSQLQCRWHQCWVRARQSFPETTECSGDSQYD
jgi:hypothetical protein